MKMESLFDDFKRYVDAMDVQAIKENIANAIEHTSNSYILDGQIDDSKNNYMNSATQKILPVYHSRKLYAFCSMDVSYASMSYEVFEGRDWVA